MFICQWRQKIFKWIRKLPHPSYGNYGGAKNTCENESCPLPVDWMDELFQDHDIALKKAKFDWEVKIADKDLWNGVKAGNKKKLAKPIWGRIYALGVLIFFFNFSIK